MLYGLTSCRAGVEPSVLADRSRAWHRKVLLGLMAALLAMASLFQASNALAQDDFLDPLDAFAFSAAMAEPDELHIHFKIAPDYYMYRERFEVSAEPGAQFLGTPVFPNGIVKYDPTFERDLEVYHDQVTLVLPVKPGARGPLTLSVVSQGCANAGLCYPPMTSTIELLPSPVGYQAKGLGVVASVPAPRDEIAGQPATAAAPGLGQALTASDTGLAAVLAQAGWLEIVGLALVFGVLLTFTPCVLPMVPIVLAVVAGDSRANGGQCSRWRGFGLAATYVLGMSLVYTVLGVAAGLIGASLAAWLQIPWVLGVFAVILGVLALAMFDVFTFQAPVGLQSRLSDRLARIPGGRWSGAFFMGMLSALIVGPCIAAPLAGVLLFISQTGDLVLGGSALFAMAWGQGVLLLLVGATSGLLLPKAGQWMDGVKRFFGMLLLATAWWMVYSVVPDWLAILGWALLALCAAVLLGVFGRVVPPQEPGLGASGAAVLGRAIMKAVGLLLAAWSLALVVGLAAGGRDLLKPLAPFSSTGTGLSGAMTGFPAPGGVASPVIFQQIASSAELDAVLATTDRPVLFDFYADWCVSCIEMERFTFTDPTVARLMSQMQLVQADVTANTPDDRALLKRFKLFGPPGILFFDAQGRPMDDARVIGFRNAQQFATVLEGVLGE